MIFSKNIFLLLLHVFFAGALYGQEKVFLQETDSAYYEFVDELPEFPGGEDSLKKFINTNLLYPSHFCGQGTIFIRIYINRKGQVVKAKTEKGIHEIINNLALNMVGKMPAWKPAIINGTNVPSQIIIPIRVFQSE